MNWYCEPGKENDVVLSTRIRISRNFADLPFITKAKESDLKEVSNRLKKLSNKIGYGLIYQELKNMDTITKQSLAEKNILENNSDIQSIAINNEENICIVANDEDHLKIQVFSAGLELNGLSDLVEEINRKICAEEKIAFSKDFGYLTSAVTNVGTAMKASIMVHLPGLKRTGNTQKICDFIEKLGMNISFANTADDIYIISTRQTLGVSEKDTIENLKIIAKSVIEQERAARKYLAENSVYLEDELFRCFGILSYAKRMKFDEANKYISCLKLAVDLGIIQGLNDSKIKKMLNFIKPANLQKLLGNTFSKEDLELERAKLIQNIIKEN